MANIVLAQRPRSLLGRLAFWYSRRRYGQVLDPLRAASRHTGVLMAMGAVELAAERTWGRLDPQLRALALQVVSGQIACPWCVDFGQWEGEQHGRDSRKLSEVAAWQHTRLYDERERCVLEFAEAATTTPAGVTEELVARLRRWLSEEEIVELAAWVALENYRSRFNASMGLTSQGFASRCPVPASVAEAPGLG